MFDTYHIHLDSKPLNKILKSLQMAQEKLDELLSKLNSQSETIDTISVSVANIDADIDLIKEGLPTEGGLTAEEVATLSTALDNLQAKTTAAKDAIAALDAENEPPATPDV